MSRRNYQARDHAWTGQPGVQRRISLISDAGLPADAPAQTRYAATAVEYYQRRGRRLQAIAITSALRAAGGWLRRQSGRLLADARAWRTARIAERELARLDDRLLRDIGIHRSQIPAVVRGALRGPRHGPVAASESMAAERTVHAVRREPDLRTRDAA